MERRHDDEDDVQLLSNNLDDSEIVQMSNNTQRRPDSMSLGVPSLGTDWFKDLYAKALEEAEAGIHEEELINQKENQMNPSGIDLQIEAPDNNTGEVTDTEDSKTSTAVSSKKFTKISSLTMNTLVMQEDANKQVAYMQAQRNIMDDQFDRRMFFRNLKDTTLAVNMPNVSELTFDFTDGSGNLPGSRNENASTKNFNQSFHNISSKGFNQNQNMDSDHLKLNLNKNGALPILLSGRTFVASQSELRPSAGDSLDGDGDASGARSHASARTTKTNNTSNISQGHSQNHAAHNSHTPSPTFLDESISNSNISFAKSGASSKLNSLIEHWPRSDNENSASIEGTTKKVINNELKKNDEDDTLGDGYIINWPKGADSSTEDPSLKEDSKQQDVQKITRPPLVRSSSNLRNPAMMKEKSQRNLSKRNLMDNQSAESGESKSDSKDKKEGQFFENLHNSSDTSTQPTPFDNVDKGNSDLNKSIFKPEENVSNDNEEIVKEENSTIEDNLIQNEEEDVSKQIIDPSLNPYAVQNFRQFLSDTKKPSSTNLTYSLASTDNNTLVTFGRMSSVISSTSTTLDGLGIALINESDETSEKQDIGKLLDQEGNETKPTIDDAHGDQSSGSASANPNSSLVSKPSSMRSGNGDSKLNQSRTSLLLQSKKVSFKEELTPKQKLKSMFEELIQQELARKKENELVTNNHHMINGKSEGALSDETEANLENVIHYDSNHPSLENAASDMLINVSELTLNTADDDESLISKLEEKSTTDIIDKNLKIEIVSQHGGIKDGSEQDSKEEQILPKKYEERIPVQSEENKVKENELNLSQLNSSTLNFEQSVSTKENESFEGTGGHSIPEKIDSEHFPECKALNNEKCDKATNEETPISNAQVQACYANRETNENDVNLKNAEQNTGERPSSCESDDNLYAKTSDDVNPVNKRDLHQYRSKSTNIFYQSETSSATEGDENYEDDESFNNPDYSGENPMNTAIQNTANVNFKDTTDTKGLQNENPNDGSLLNREIAEDKALDSNDEDLHNDNDSHNDGKKLLQQGELTHITERDPIDEYYSNGNKTLEFSNLSEKNEVYGHHSKLEQALKLSNKEIENNEASGNEVIVSNKTDESNQNNQKNEILREKLPKEGKERAESISENVENSVVSVDDLSNSDPVENDNSIAQNKENFKSFEEDNTKNHHTDQKKLDLSDGQMNLKLSSNDGQKTKGEIVSSNMDLDALRMLENNEIINNSQNQDQHVAVNDVSIKIEKGDRDAMNSDAEVSKQNNATASSDHSANSSITEVFREESVNKMIMCEDESEQTSVFKIKISDKAKESMGSVGMISKTEKKKNAHHTLDGKREMNEESQDVIESNVQPDPELRKLINRFNSSDPSLTSSLSDKDLTKETHKDPSQQHLPLTTRTVEVVNVVNEFEAAENDEVLYHDLDVENLRGEARRQIYEVQRKEMIERFEQTEEGQKLRAKHEQRLESNEEEIVDVDSSKKEIFDEPKSRPSLPSASKEDANFSMLTCFPLSRSIRKKKTNSKRLPENEGSVSSESIDKSSNFNKSIRFDRNDTNDSPSEKMSTELEKYNSFDEESCDSSVSTFDNKDPKLQSNPSSSPPHPDNRSIEIPKGDTDESSLKLETKNSVVKGIMMAAAIVVMIVVGVTVGIFLPKKQPVKFNTGTGNSTFRENHGAFSPSVAPSMDPASSFVENSTDFFNTTIPLNSTWNNSSEILSSSVEPPQMTNITPFSSTNIPEYSSINASIPLTLFNSSEFHASNLSSILNENLAPSQVFSGPSSTASTSSSLMINRHREHSQSSFSAEEASIQQLNLTSEGSLRVRERVHEES